jgi:hypothetical protein
MGSSRDELKSCILSRAVALSEPGDRSPCELKPLSCSPQHNCAEFGSLHPEGRLSNVMEARATHESHIWPQVWHSQG